MIRLCKLAAFHRRGGASWPRAVRKACAVIWLDLVEPIRLTY